MLVDRTMRVISQILLEGGYGHDRRKGLYEDRCTPIGVERDAQRFDSRGGALALDKDAVAVGGWPDAVEDAEGSKFAQHLAQR